MIILMTRPRPKKTWDEVLVDDRMKLGMVSVDPQNLSEWKGHLRGRFVRQAQPSVEENRFLNDDDDDDDNDDDDDDMYTLEQLQMSQSKTKSPTRDHLSKISINLPSLNFRYRKSWEVGL